MQERWREVVRAGTGDTQPHDEPVINHEPVVNHDATAQRRPLIENTDACLDPADTSQHGFPLYTNYVHRALKLDPNATTAAMVVTPSFKPPWMLSLHHHRNGNAFLRVTRIDQDVWGAMMTRMQEQQGASVSLAEHLQERALAKLSVTATVTERSVDPRTARLFSALWKGLIRRAQVVHWDGAKFDGVGYYLWQGGTAGITQSPRLTSILSQATFAAERLSRIVETPSPTDSENLAFFRDEMRKAIERTKHKEPCSRPYRDLN